MGGWRAIFYSHPEKAPRIWKFEKNDSCTLLMVKNCYWFCFGYIVPHRPQLNITIWIYWLLLWLRWSFITTFLCTKTNTLCTIKSITACLRRNAKTEMVSNYIFPLLNNQGNMKRGFFAFYNFPCNYSGCETSSMIFTWCFIIWVSHFWPRFYLLLKWDYLYF